MIVNRKGGDCGMWLLSVCVRVHVCACVPAMFPSTSAGIGKHGIQQLFYEALRWIAWPCSGVPGHRHRLTVGSTSPGESWRLGELLRLQVTPGWAFGGHALS